MPFMSTIVASPYRVPALSWWAMLACVIAAGMLVNWFVATAVLVVLLAQVYRPFDFVVAFFLTTAGSTFVYYEGGNTAFEMSLLSCAILAMLACYVLSNPGQILAVPRTRLTWAILAYLLLSMANAGRGVMSGYSMRYLLLDVLPVLAVGTSLLVGNGFDPKRDLRPIVWGLTGLAYGSAALGFYVFTIVRTHTSGIYFNATPGMIALLLVNLALRARSVWGTLLWTGLSLPLFLHQFLSFRRSLWVGCMAGMITSILVFALGRGKRGRWKRVGWVLGVLVAVGALGAASLELFYGQGDILRESAGRFATIGSTQLTMETRSNVIRLVETAGVLDLIWQSPWIGYGLGYAFIVPHPLWGVARPQWWMDENYLLIWLKQGLVGLLIYLWILWTAFSLGVRQARSRENPLESSWFAGLAAAMAFTTLFSLTDWPFGQVNPAFLLALMFGGAMAMTSTGRLRLRWSGSE